ncbi:MAG: stage V sporulation protein AD [Clostridia bacterium]|nr:stage V sporulation protein AD [Clostridia bacterium]
MRMGKQTVKLEAAPTISNTAATVGKKEGEGPLAEDFDVILDDDYYGEKSWEKAESKLQEQTAKLVLQKAGLSESDMNYVLAGDLLNQCVGAHYAMRELDIPFLGLYGACSTMAESMMIGSMLIGGGLADNALCVTSSHYCSAEKQYRYPLEYGGQRAPSAQWTVTGSGAAVLEAQGEGPYIHAVTTGKIIDMGISDVNNMGAAMAPAAADTLTALFKDTKTMPEDYDLILTGDLALIGSDVLCELMDKNGYNIYPMHADCGKMIFNIKEQDVHAGGSGCGCCGSVFCGHIFKEIKKGNIKRMILMATGALMNPMTLFQGETIPAIAHALVITTEKEAFF